MKGLFFLLVALAIAKLGSASTVDRATSIVDKARSYIGSRRWMWMRSYWEARQPPLTIKSNIFVADVLREVGAPAPNRYSNWFSPIGAGEWGNPSSSYLLAAPCWNRCYTIQSSDVIAEHGHVGIVTGQEKTTSAYAAAIPPGKVVENNWGFRSGNNPICWRYTCQTNNDYVNTFW